MTQGEVTPTTRGTWRPGAALTHSSFICSHLAKAHCCVSGEYMSFRMFGNVTNPVIPCVPSLSCHPHNPAQRWGQEAKQSHPFPYMERKRNGGAERWYGLPEVTQQAGGRIGLRQSVPSGSPLLVSWSSCWPCFSGDGAAPSHRPAWGLWVCTVTVPGLADTADSTCPQKSAFRRGQMWRQMPMN